MAKKLSIRIQKQEIAAEHRTHFLSFDTKSGYHRRLVEIGKRQ